MIRIKNGTLPNGTAADISVEGGLVTSLKKSLTRRKGEEVLDATGCLVLPGVVDIGARLLPNGASNPHQTLEHEIRGGLLAGVTSLFPRSPETLLTSVTALPGLVVEGEEGADLIRAAIVARARGIFLYVEPSVRRFSPLGVMHESSLSFELGLEGIPSSGEDVAVAEVLEIARAYAVQLHIAKISTARSVELIRRAKAEGTQVTAGVSVHHLLLTAKAVRGFDASAKLSPPLRDEEDRVALIAGVSDGTIDCVISDHHPKGEEEMNIEFARTPFGCVGLQVLLPGVLSLTNLMPLERAIDAITAAPLRCMRDLEMANRREISIGRSPDIVVFNQHKSWTLDTGTNTSCCRNSPHWGSSFTGAVRHVIRGGEVVVRDGLLVEESQVLPEEIKKVSN